MYICAIAFSPKEAEEGGEGDEGASFCEGEGERWEFPAAACRVDTRRAEELIEKTGRRLPGELCVAPLRPLKTALIQKGGRPQERGSERGREKVRAERNRV